MPVRIQREQRPVRERLVRFDGCVGGIKGAAGRGGHLRGDREATQRILADHEALSLRQTIGPADVARLDVTTQLRLQAIQLPKRRRRRLPGVFTGGTGDPNREVSRHGFVIKPM